MTVEKTDYAKTRKAVLINPKGGFYLVSEGYKVGIDEVEISMLLMALDRRKELNNENKLEELRDGITDDTRYILDKMERMNDYFKLKSVLEALEVITAEI